MIFEDKTALLRGGLFKVQNEVGLGRSEDIYHQSFCHWLRSHNVPHASKPPHPILFENDQAHVVFPDLVTWDCITIELKSLPRRLLDEDRVQIHNYLKRRKDRLGLLVNMGLDRVYVERVVYDAPSYEMTEHWEAWHDSITGNARDTGNVLRTTIESLFRQHQTGYGSELTEKLLLFALRKNSLSIVLNPLGASYYLGTQLGTSPLDCIVVNKEILIVFTALFDDNSFNIRRGRSFMKCLGLKWGVAINFGKKALEVNALSNHQ